MAKLKKIDGALLRKMIICGTNNLVANKERVNSLNVFPVPDGDTGTNMSLTAIAAAKEVAKLDTDDIFAISKAAASGALRGGRGNSGVIFSQFFRGFSRALEGLRSVGTREIADAFANASKTAYKAVMRPQEGTILTVGRHMAEVAQKYAYATDDIRAFAKQIISEGHAMLKRTPEMLPVLKQAGVVDSGGDGLMCFLVGAMDGVDAIDPQIVEDAGPSSHAQAEADFSAIAGMSHEEITFGYCTEFFINVEGFSEEAEDEFKAYLETMGDSVAMVADDEIVKVHVHTDNPGAVMERAMQIGPLSAIKIDNMRMQHAEAGGLHSQSEAPRKPMGVVAISSGTGFKEIFMDLGADYVIEGGQTMNPSAEDIARGVQKVNADNIIILPNNKNIILAASQAAELCEGQNVVVVASKTMPQGISALMNYLPEDDAEDAFANNVAQMEEALTAVATGQITVAIRDTELDGHNVREGDYIGILDGKIVCTHADIKVAAVELIDIMMADGYDIFTVYPGAEASAEHSAIIEAHLAENYADCEATAAFGGQAVYNFIFSAE
ncbi:MAG: DAK2 domain-containing protein [Clostridiales bacterium]|jgi:DAK2 domain fusion protein YloV|nr:DAK2 domain-containing protein [Clostridiales bacterium]